MADIWLTYGRHMADMQRTYGGYTANIRRTSGEHMANIRQKYGEHASKMVAEIRQTFGKHTPLWYFGFTTKYNKHSANIQLPYNTLFTIICFGPRMPGRLSPRLKRPGTSNYIIFPFFSNVQFITRITPQNIIFKRIRKLSVFSLPILNSGDI